MRFSYREICLILISYNKVISNWIFKRWYATLEQQNPSVLDIFDEPDSLPFWCRRMVHHHHVSSVKWMRVVKWNFRGNWELRQGHICDYLMLIYDLPIKHVNGNNNDQSSTSTCNNQYNRRFQKICHNVWAELIEIH